MPYLRPGSVVPARAICVLLWLMIGACSNQPGVSVNLQRLDLTVLELAAPDSLILAASRGDAAATRQALEQGALINAVSPIGTAFSEALKNGHDILALFLLARGADWRNGFSPDEPNALTLAASRGHDTLVKELLLRGSDLEAIDPEGYTALARAALNGHLTTMKILTNAGADVNVVVRDRSILMHVVEANHMLLAQVLITAGANVNFRDANGDTALRIARRYEYFDLDLMLVQAGGRL